MSVRYYDHNAQVYAARKLASPRDVDALKAFCEDLPVGARILDAGCGVGADLNYFVSRGFEAHGVDGSREMVLLSRSSGAHVWQSDLQLLSVPPESYDGIWAHRSLLHLNADGCRRVMALFFKVIKPRGNLFVSMDECDSLKFGQGEFEQLEDRRDDPNGPVRIFFRYRADDFTSLIRQSGFRIVAQGRSLKGSPTLGVIAKRI